MSPSVPAVISTVGSVVEKSHFSRVLSAVRQKISRPRVSIERSPISSHRHAAPLEMTQRPGSIGSWKKETDSKSTTPPSTCHPERQRRILVHGAGVPMVLNTSLRGVTCLTSDFHSLSFQPQRMSVEKSHPSMLHAAVRQEISRLRVSIERSPISSHRHAAPLEMTRRRAAYIFFGIKKLPRNQSMTVFWKSEVSESQCPWCP